MVNRVLTGTCLKWQIGCCHVQVQQHYSGFDRFPHTLASDLLPAAGEVLVPVAAPNRVRLGKCIRQSANRWSGHLLK